MTPTHRNALRGEPSRRAVGAAWRAFGGAAAPPAPRRGRRLGEAVLVAAAALVGIGMYVAARSREADRSRPPRGRFVEVDGVRVHVVTRGEGPPVVLLHGNGSMVDELEASGVLDILARHYRVVALDRPGSGYSGRLPDGAATARAQAALVASVLDRLGIDRATIVGHSWGTLVALALALDQPQRVRGLVLVAGYYYPTLRPDALLFAAPDWPVVGALLGRTISPLAGRLSWPALMRLAFGPPATPARFARLPAWSFLEPSRLRAAAAERRMLSSEAAKLSRRYGEVRVPTVILAGENDRIVSVWRHAERLHHAIAGSVLHSIPGMGHMIHHVVPGRVLRAVDEIALRDARGAGPLAERTAGPPLRELLREVPHAPGEHGTTA